MRVISLLIAIAVAAVTGAAAPDAAGAGRWVRPVPGETARAFDYAPAAPFVAGAHRGIDLIARPGAPVRAACGGLVLHAGPVAGAASVVSVRCGSRRVSHLPLASVRVAAGAEVRAGASVGTLARGHGGLHLGVRREGDPFAYEDPAALLPEAAPPLPALPPPAPRSTVPPRARPLLVSPRPQPQVLVAPRATAPSQPRPLPVSTAPWPVWAGLALAVVGTVGSGAAVRVRRRRVARHRVVAEGAGA